MLTALTPIAPTLAKCLRLLASDKDGEYALASLIETTADNPNYRPHRPTPQSHAVRVMLRAC